MQRQFEKFYEEDWDACAPAVDAPAAPAEPAAPAALPEDDLPPWDDAEPKAASPLAHRSAPLESPPPPLSASGDTRARRAEDTEGSNSSPEPAAISDSDGAVPVAPDPANGVAAKPTTAPRPQRAFAVPAMMCRSALFSAGEGTGQDALAKRGIASYPAYEIELDGPRLTMRDKAIWEQVAAEAWKRELLGELFPISLGRIHKAVTGSKRSPSQTEREAILVRLRRLAQCAVAYSMVRTTRDERVVLATGEAKLLTDLTPVEPLGRGGVQWMVRFDAGWAPLFAVDTLCPLRPSVSKHRPSELALWLRDFLGSNKAHAYELRRLREISGFDAAKDKFPSRLRQAMAFLAERCPDIVAKWSLDESQRAADAWTLATEPAQDPKVKVSKAGAKKRAAPEAVKEPMRASHAKKGPKRSGGVAL